MIIIDKYSRYTKEAERKDKIYGVSMFGNRTATEEEKAMVEELKGRLDDFLIKTRGHALTHSSWGFDYIKDLGFISVTATFDEKTVNYFGNTVDKAFYDIMCDYELKTYSSFEPSEKVYSALLDFKKYYGNDIPEEVINYYKWYLSYAEQEESSTKENNSVKRPKK